MAKKTFESAFGLDEVKDDKIDEVTEDTTDQKTKPEENIQQETITLVKPEESKNVVVTYNNPMDNLVKQYDSILKKIQDDENEILVGFKKRPAQSEVYANATVQIRRDLYAAINDYILDMRLGKTKVLNEIFMLGINEFIKKFNK